MSFSIYIILSSLESILRYAFILERLNYERWLAVHVEGLQRSRNPDLHAEFYRGHFAVSGSRANQLSHKKLQISNQHQVVTLRPWPYRIGPGEFENIIMGSSNVDDYEHCYNDHASNQTDDSEQLYEDDFDLDSFNVHSNSPFIPHFKSNKKVKMLVAINGIGIVSRCTTSGRLIRCWRKVQKDNNFVVSHFRNCEHVHLKILKLWLPHRNG